MERSTKHLILSAAARACTLVVFLAFYGSLPESIPVQFSVTGTVNAYWPREAVVFGAPTAFVLIDVAAGLSVAKKDDARAWMYWIVPAIAFAVTGLVLFAGTR